MNRGRNTRRCAFASPAKVGIGIGGRPRVRSHVVAVRAAPSDSTRARPSVTDMYVALREMERAAEEEEIECVANAGSSAAASECTANFIEASDELELAKLAALASGTGTQEERVVSKEAAKRARKHRKEAVLEVRPPSDSYARRSP